MKQPYIPLYTSDYIKDTRKLTLELRGFWADLIVFSWDSAGVLLEDISDLSRMIGVDKQTVNQCLNALVGKGVCDVEFLDGDRVKIGVRWIIRHKAKSHKMSEIGKLGGNPNLKKDNQKVKQKDKQPAYPSFDNDISTEIDNSKLTTISKKKAAKENSTTIPPFDSEEFTRVWNTWIEYRKQIKKPYKSDLSVQLQFKKLSEHPEEVAIKMILRSIQNQWQGIFPLNENGSGTRTKQITKEGAERIVNDFKNVASRRGQQGI